MSTNTKSKLNSKSQGKSSTSGTEAGKTGKQSKGWEWAPFTKKAVEFNHAAKVLSDLLKSDYGDNVSISSFEKMIAAIPSMTEAQRSLIHVSGVTTEALVAFRAARAARDSERDNFRGDIQIGNVESGLEVLANLGVVNDGQEGENEEEEE